MDDLSGPALGVFPDASYKMISVTLGTGDAMFLYTDGVTEAMNEKRELFTDERLLEASKAFQQKDAKEAIEAILLEVRQHTGGMPQTDDIAMMMIRYLKENEP